LKNSHKLENKEKREFYLLQQFEEKMKKLFRSKYDRKLAGVCGGLGSYLNVDPTIIRLVMLFVCIFTAVVPLVVAYCIAVLIIPEETKEEPLQMNYRKFYRSTKDRKIAGICGGLGELTKLDPVFLRLMFLFICIITAVVPLVVAYLIGWVIIPEKPQEH
jgi:phage shock protein PspC (stress-responsive transcriptional regulator)